MKRHLKRWAQVIAHFLKPGGFFYIVEDHPFMRVFSSDPEQDIKVDNPYFFSEEPYKAELQDRMRRTSRVRNVPTICGITAWEK